VTARLILPLVLLLAGGVSAQGTVTVLVMPVNSFNNTVETYTLDELAAAWQPNSDLTRFFVGLSSGKLTGFTATVRPWVTRPSSAIPVINYSACTGVVPTHATYLQSTATAAATAAGVNPNAFTRRAFMMPSFTCAANAEANRPNLNVYGRIEVSIWAHELLHTYGLGHPYGEICDPSGCTTGIGGNYTDVYNVMSNAWAWEYPGLFERLQIALTTGTQWLDPARVPVITTGGTFTLLDVEAQSGQIGIRIPGPSPDVNGNVDTLGVEVRRDGVVIRRVFDQGGFYRNPTLLDMDLAAGGLQPILAPGRSYTWQGRTITVVTYTSGSALVSVTGLGGAVSPPLTVSNLRAQ
jgi:hypothetical protein